MSQAIAYTYTEGVIRFARKCPRGALPIAYGDKARLREVIEVIARHGYTPGVLLVPGMPEAPNQEAALEALMLFQDRVAQTMTRWMAA